MKMMCGPARDRRFWIAKKSLNSFTHLTPHPLQKNPTHFHLPLFSQSATDLLHGRSLVQHGGGLLHVGRAVAFANAD